MGREGVNCSLKRMVGEIGVLVCIRAGTMGMREENRVARAL